MRTYPLDSPQAAARVLAVAMLADGHLSSAELDTASRLDACAQLGLSPAELESVLHAFCHDLLATRCLANGSFCAIDEQTLSALLAEVQDPALRRLVIRLCTEVMNSDAHLADGEATVLAAALDQWIVSPAPRSAAGGFHA